MGKFQLSIDPRIFSLFPEYARGVVTATKIKNSATPEELIALLRGAEAELRKKVGLETLATHPGIAVWREAFRKTGVKPADFRPSVEGLARRVLHDQEIPSINALVDIGNLISIKYLIPVGGHAIDQLTDSMRLTISDGSEDFIPFGSTELEHPAEEEIIFTEGKQVITRRWIWRQAQRTLTEMDTTAIEINLDGMPPTGQVELQGIADEMMGLIQHFCGGNTKYTVLDRDHAEMELP